MFNIYTNLACKTNLIPLSWDIRLFDDDITNLTETRFYNSFSVIKKGNRSQKINKNK